MPHPYIDEVDIAQVMEIWDIETYNGSPASIRYTNYLLSLRDFRIQQLLDSWCGYDIDTALKIAEMS